MTELLSPDRPRRTIRQRLVWGNVVIGVLLLLASSIAIWQISRLTEAVGVLQVARKRATTALEVHQHSTQLVAMVSRLLPVEDAVVFETEVAEALDALKESHSALEALTAEATEDEAAYPLMNRVSDRINSVIGIAETMVRQASAGQWPSVLVRVGVLTRDHQQLASETNRLVELAAEMEEAAAMQVASAQRAAILYPALAVALSIALGVVLTWQTTRRIAQPVEQLTEGAAHLAAGLLDKRVTVESTDELGRLADAFNRMADRLQASHAELEQRVAERTADLQRRAVQLQAAAEVARDATAMRDLDNLLNHAVSLIQDRFGFYHAAIFLVDKRGEYAVLRSATGEAGRQMLERGHRLKVGEVGVVGHVAGTGRPLVTLDVGAEAVHFENLLLPETRSEVALPLKVGERVIGALDVQSQRAAAFDEDDVTVLQTMADQLAMAIENAHLLRDMQQTMHELAQERNLLKATLDALPDLLLEVDRYGRVHDFHAPSPEMLHLLPSQKFRDQPVDRVFPEEAASIIMDAIGQAFETGRHAGVIYPLETPAGPGWFELSITAKGDPKMPDARFIALVRDVTARVQAEEALRQHSRDLALLNRASRALTSTLDLDQVLVTVLEEVRRLLGVVACSIWLTDPDTNGLICQQAIGPHSEIVYGWRLAPGEGLAGWVAHSGEGLIVPDAWTDERHFKGVDQQTGLAMRSILNVPLRVKQDVIGVLQVMDTEADRFSAMDLTLLEPLAASAAIAVDNARLVEALRQRTLELEVRNEELDAFAHTAAHDLKNPLARIVGFAHVLEEDYTELPDEDVRRYLHRMAQNGRKMSNIIDELLLLAQVRKMEAEMRPLDMASIVDEAQQRLADMIEEHGVEIDLPDTWPRALGYGPWVEEVWVNYLSNAINYGGQPPRVELGATEQADGTVRFWVRDNGPGLTPEEQARLFIPFTKLDQVRTKGHGVGLSIVRRIVEKLGGQVGVESQVGQGSVFTFTLPGPRQ